MANMSYCRFQNTYRDLKDCVESLESNYNLKYGFRNLDNLSSNEKKYALKLRELCREYLELVESEEGEENV